MGFAKSETEIAERDDRYLKAEGLSLAMNEGEIYKKITKT